MHRLLVIVFLFFAASIHVLSLGKAGELKKQLPQYENDAFVLPSPVLKIAVLEYQGLAADVLFLKSMVFLGSTQERKETPKVKEWEWKWLTDTLGQTTDLDPYFLDPYFFANAFLPWDAHMVEEANKLLKKGSRYRDWDWMMPFFVGFNDFFFLHNDEEAISFLMEASRRPGGDPMFASIAARLAFKENRAETAIFLLEETAKRTDNEAQRKRFEARIQALRSIVDLDRAVTLYKKKFSRMPSTVDDLVSRKILSRLPVDPYGGTYYIDKDGKVKSTTGSELDLYLSRAARSQR